MRFFEKGFWCGLFERAMPDSLTMAVTTGLGFSVIAGIVSGLCYVLTYGLPRARGRKPQTPWHCAVCGGQFRSIDGILEVDSVAKCARCGRRVCKERCSRRAPDKEDGGWLCVRCEPDTWIAGLLSALQTKSNREWYSTKTMNQETPHEVDEDLLELQRREREQVRDFIERLVGALLGGDLDNVSVKKLYNDSKYDALYARYHGEISNALTDLGSALHISVASKWYLPIAGQSPCSAHTTLKLLIQRFIQEAHELPKLRKFDSEDAASSDRTYEDLLSTAIINKVVQNCQDGGPSRSASRASSKKSDKEYFFGARNLEDTSSLSSMDDYSETMSLKVPRRIKEVSSSDDARDEDEDWQDNWRLQRKKFDGTHSPVPVPMLVPDPITEAKVLIGDREADDTTDLSDAASDYEEAEEPEPTTLNAVLVNSRTVIGGKNPLLAKEVIEEDGSTDDEELREEKEDIVKQLNSLEADDESITETKNHRLIEEEDKGVDETSFMSLDSNTEKDLEYTERYASLPRTIYKCPKPAPRNSTLTVPERNSTPNSDLTTDNVDSGVTSDEDEKQRVFKGTYSEREKEKWNHAVPLANNPYSKSNLERRLSSSRSSNSSLSPTSENSESAMADSQGKKSLFAMLDEDRKKGNHVFDRDYYIREAAKSAGARKATSPTASLPSNPLVDEELIFKAVPAVVQDDDSSIEPPTPTRPNHLDLSSDSDYSLERSYNLQSGEIRKQPNRTEVIKAASSPEGHLDENHNDKLKRDFLKSLTEEETSTSSFDSVNPPAVNHFRLVDEIAKETPEQYVEVPISPPPAYKTDECHHRLKSPELIKMIQEIDSAAPVTPPSSPKDFSLTYSEPEEIVDVRNTEVVSIAEENLEENSDENLIEAVRPEDIVLEPASVKRLSKIFDQNKNGKQDVYSLTARSIPKQFRRELSKELSLSQENIKDVIRADPPSEEVVLPFPKAKSKIDFFEKLKN